LGPDDTTDRARVLVALASELHHGSDPRRYDLAREAVTVARRTGDPSCLADVLGLAGLALWVPGNLTERVEMATEMSELAERLDDPVLLANAALALYLGTAQQGDLDRARAALATATGIAETLAQPALQMRAAGGQSSCAMLEGRFADAEGWTVEALRCAEALGNPDRVPRYHTPLGLISLLLARPMESVDHLVAAVDSSSFAGLEAGLAFAYADAGQAAEAREIIARLGGSSLSGVGHDYLRVTILAIMAGACAALGEDRELAVRLYDELLPCRSQVALVQTASVGVVAHYLGLLAAMLGRLDEANGHFAFADDLQARTGARGLLPRTRLEWARLLLRRGAPGDAGRARSLARAAVELAHELDAPAIAERALDLLDSMPATTGYPTNPAGCSSRAV
jgi:tetratricopeptide (TPR) repeat protein